MRRDYFIWVASFLIITVMIISILLYRSGGVTAEMEQARYEDLTEKNRIDSNMINSDIVLVETANTEEKVSPNCMFIFKTYYSKCEHIKVEREQAQESMVNKTREGLEEIFTDWKIVTFRSDEVLFYREDTGICGEHYLLKDLDGNIAIYTIDESGEQSLVETTSIVINYLGEEDMVKLRDGIRVDGKDKLNQTLEDYE